MDNLRSSKQFWEYVNKSCKHTEISSLWNVSITWYCYVVLYDRRTLGFDFLCFSLQQIDQQDNYGQFITQCEKIKKTHQANVIAWWVFLIFSHCVINCP